MGGRGSSFGSDTLGKKGRPLTIAQALKNINPHYHEGRQWQINCQRCVYAYEMARRGYDVEALPYKDDLATRAWQNIMKNQSWETLGSRNTISQLESKMQNWGEGSRAVIYVVWKGGRSSHVFNAERVNGKTVYVDAQTGKMVDINSYMESAIKGKTMISRVDHLEPSNLITECVQRRKK